MDDPSSLSSGPTHSRTLDHTTLSGLTVTPPRHRWRTDSCGGSPLQEVMPLCDNRLSGRMARPTRTHRSHRDGLGHCGAPVGGQPGGQNSPMSHPTLSSHGHAMIFADRKSPIQQQQKTNTGSEHLSSDLTSNCRHNRRCLLSRLRHVTCSSYAPYLSWP